MNQLRKILSFALAAVLLLSASVTVTGAATRSESCGNPKVYVVNGCQNFDSCKNIFDYFKSNGYDLQKLLRQYASKNNESAAPATQPSTQAPTTPAAPSAQPAEKPDEPATQPATQPQPAASDAEAYENEVIRLVNIERANYGLSPLAKRDDATAAARIRAKEIVQAFSHTRPNGTSCFTVCKELGISYRSAGENIAYGYRTPQQVIEGWMNSEGHRKNILSASFTSIGVGCYRQGGTLYWSQLFLG